MDNQFIPFVNTIKIYTLLPCAAVQRCVVGPPITRTLTHIHIHPLSLYYSDFVTLTRRYCVRPGRTSPPYPGHDMVDGQQLRTDWFPVLYNNNNSENNDNNCGNDDNNCDNNHEEEKRPADAKDNRTTA